MKHRGIARIVEAVFSAILIIAAVSISYHLLIPPNPSTIRSNEELSKFGYSLLSSLGSDNGYDKLLFDKEGNLREGWENDFKVVINSLVPPNIIFNITVYNATVNSSTGFVDLEKLNTIPISNTDSNEVFLKAGENIQVMYIYTTYNSVEDKIQIIYIFMKLAVLRGA